MLTINLPGREIVNMHDFKIVQMLEENKYCFAMKSYKCKAARYADIWLCMIGLSDILRGRG